MSISDIETTSIPDIHILTTGLNSVFDQFSFGKGGGQILNRQQNIYSSSFPSEIIRYRLESGQVLPLFIKYDCESSHTGHGYWHGVSYEATIYQRVLQSLPISIPQYYGTFANPASNQTSLVLKYMEKSVRITKSCLYADNIIKAARWLGQFHALNEEKASSTTIADISIYDLDFYIGWARRTSLYAGSLHETYPWLASLCDRFKDIVLPLMGTAQTIIHGEFYPKNILVSDDNIYPVDWCSAAIGPGEIDLASLLQNWRDEELIESCKDEYQQARWQGEAPENFDQTLSLARLYWYFRWLGDNPEWTVKMHHAFEELRIEAERVGLF
jgi:thiamine kinase-like enzyme